LEHGGKAELAAALESRRGEDLDRGFTGTGPHRDDLNLEVASRLLRQYGSHGQARTALATLKLGEVAYYTHARTRQPILVMDEVTSVLDRNRTVNLIALLSREASQVFITSPTADGFDDADPGVKCVIRVDEKKTNDRHS
jgi:DNA replication and repair protein RecF